MLVVSLAQEKALVLSLQVSQQAHYREGCLSLQPLAFGILVDLSSNKFIVGADSLICFLESGYNSLQRTNSRTIHKDRPHMRTDGLIILMTPSVK